MSTTCTHNVNNFRFTVTGKLGDKYELHIDNPLPWDETVTAYGMLVKDGEDWILEDMTFENAHQECVLQLFFIDLWKIRKEAYRKAIQYYEANIKPVDTVTAVSSLFDSFKKAI
jgi:hypothetical protein